MSSPVAGPSHEFSLFSGGPLDRLERAVGLPHDPRDQIIRRSVALLLVAWIPLVFLALLRSMITGEPPTFLLNLDLHVRWWLAVPVLFFGEMRIDRRVRASLKVLLDSGIIPPAERERFLRTQRAIERMGDSSLAELALLVASVAASGPALLRPLPPAEVWQLAVSLPLFRFLVVRFLWRWLLWSYLLLRLSRLELALIGTHPDRSGGLGILSVASRTFGIVAFGVAAVGAASWAGRIHAGEATFADVRTPALVFLLIVLIVALGPLAFFGPALSHTKDRFVHQYSAFAYRYTSAFHQKWIDTRGADALGSPDIQSLADLGSSFEVVDKMWILPFNHQTIIYLVVASLLPLAPLYLMSIPMSELLKEMLGLIF